MTADRQVEPRVPLTRQRVLVAAVSLADREGIGAVTMRKLAAELGVEAMSLYHHVGNKEELLDGMVDEVIGEINQAVRSIPLPENPSAWKDTLRRRILTAREHLLRHRWAQAVLESRTSMSPEAVRYFESVVALLRFAGFSYHLAHHALHALGSRALGFTQELFVPGDAVEEAEDPEALLAAMAAETPYLVEMMAEIAHDDPDTTLGWCDDQAEFEFGLDLLLDGLDRLLPTGT